MTRLKKAPLIHWQIGGTSIKFREVCANTQGAVVIPNATTVAPWQRGLPGAVVLSVDDEVLH